MSDEVKQYMDGNSTIPPTLDSRIKYSPKFMMRLEVICIVNMSIFVISMRNCLRLVYE